MCICITNSLCCTCETNIWVNQPYPNKKVAYCWCLAHTRRCKQNSSYCYKEGYTFSRYFVNNLTFARKETSPNSVRMLFFCKQVIVLSKKPQQWPLPIPNTASEWEHQLEHGAGMVIPLRKWSRVISGAMGSLLMLLLDSYSLFERFHTLGSKLRDLGGGFSAP